MGILTKLASAMGDQTALNEENKSRKSGQHFRRTLLEADKERLAKHQKYRKQKVAQVEEKLMDVFAKGVKEGAVLKPTVLAKSRKRENAMSFRNKLLSANYEADPISEKGKDGFFFVRGTSIARVVDKENMQEWVGNICNAAFKHHCVFLDWEIEK